MWPFKKKEAQAPTFKIVKMAIPSAECSKIYALYDAVKASDVSNRQTNRYAFWTYIGYVVPRSIGFTVEFNFDDVTEPYLEVEIPLEPELPLKEPDEEEEEEEEIWWISPGYPAIASKDKFKKDPAQFKTRRVK